ncbi:hypothetical protein [Rhodococcoides yunnanense]|uniref:hypothetical protein n=1 Tax=Rhodococcoides yunnanense TaxID=278209 RepID=UPI00093382EA|nr:hypothetical protein [Rhodococcus yunnanensis]
MRDKAIAVSAVAIAGTAVVVGLGIGAVGGAFDDDTQRVQPPALRSDLSTAVSAVNSSAITVPPSPTWQVAVPTLPRTTTPEVTATTTPEVPETTTRAPRNRSTTTDKPDEESNSETTTTR